MLYENLVRTQQELRKKLILEDKLPEEIKLIGGVDQHCHEDVLRSCIVVLNYPELDVVEQRSAELSCPMPYVPGFLAFRELPTIIEAYTKLETKPDVLLIDGHGIAHPQRFGLASHVGVILDVPTIGVAKKRLIGEYYPPKNEGDFTLLRDGEEIIGAVYLSKSGCRPIFISPGHRVSLYTSMRIVEACIKEKKLPEPLQLAHICSRKHIKLTRE